MNQWIEIDYKPFGDNYWNIWFALNDKSYREKAPSVLNSNGYWSWFIHNDFEKNGKNFDWNK